MVVLTGRGCDGILFLNQDRSISAKLRFQKDHDNWFQSPLDLIIDNDNVIDGELSALFTCKDATHGNHIFLLQATDEGSSVDFNGQLKRLIPVIATRISGEDTNSRPTVTKID